MDLRFFEELKPNPVLKICWLKKSIRLIKEMLVVIKTTEVIFQISKTKAA